MSDTKACPFCGEQIKSIALKCKHCGKSLIEEASPEEISSNLFWDGMGGESGRLTESPQAGQSADPEEKIKISLSDKYEIIEEAGRGGMAIIYKAIQKNLNREVALKVLPKHFVHDEEYLVRFHREAREVAKLSHTNIVTIFDEGEKDGTHYLSMEFLDGRDLQEIIKEAAILGVDRTVEIIISISEALDYVHKKGLVHRDIKSSNIFLLKDGRSVLTDFGIARTASKTKLTQAGTVMGTPDYMSPEQAEGDEVDGRSDIYGLGVVMYECLTGTVPFKADNPLTLIRKIIDEKPGSPRDKNSQIPKWLNDVILKTLEKNPDNRILTGAHLAQSLREQKVIAGDLSEYKSGKVSKPESTQAAGKETKKKSKDDLTQYVSARTTSTKKPKSKAALFSVLTIIALAAAAVVYFFVLNQEQIPVVDIDKPDDVDTNTPAVTSTEETKPVGIPPADSLLHDSPEESTAGTTQVSSAAASDPKDEIKQEPSVEKPVQQTEEKTEPPAEEKGEQSTEIKTVTPVVEKPVKNEETKEVETVKQQQTNEQDLEKARKEQTLIRIRQLESDLEKAKVEEADAKKKYDHAKKMREKNLMSPADLNFAELEYETAKSKVEDLEISLKVLKKQIEN